MSKFVFYCTLLQVEGRTLKSCIDNLLHNLNKTSIKLNVGETVKNYFTDGFKIFEVMLYILRTLNMAFQHHPTAKKSLRELSFVFVI